MNTIQINTYDYNELSDKAKTNAFNNWNPEYFGHDENEQVLIWFQKVFDVKVSNYEYGGCNSFINWESEFTTDQDELNGKRLISFLWNNFSLFLYSGKYYSLWSKTEKNANGHAKLKSRRGLNLEESTPLGVWIGGVIVAPMHKVLRGDFINKDYNLRDCIGECLQSWLNACNQDHEYQMSEECFAEECEANQYEFTENGKILTNWI